MKTFRLLVIVGSLTAAIGCVAETEEDPPEVSRSPVIEGPAEGARQAEITATAVSVTVEVETGTEATGVAVDVGYEMVTGMTDIEAGPSRAVDATTEVYETLVNDGLLTTAGAAVSQFLVPDPTDGTGPIAATLGAGGDGPACGSVTSFQWQGAISETDPPLARLVVFYDSSVAARCTQDGTIQYDLRNDPAAAGLEALRLVISYPDGFSTSGDDGTRAIDAGGSVTLGLLFDGVLRFSGLEVSADYCVGDGTGPAELCLRDLTLVVSGAITANHTRNTCDTCTPGALGSGVAERLAGDELELMVGAGALSFRASGSVEWDGTERMTWGDGVDPLLFEIASDETGLHIVLDGNASSSIDGTTTEMVFEALEGAAEPGLRAVVPSGTASAVVDGCAAMTVDAALTETCWDAFTVGGELGTTGTRITGDGTMTRTVGTDVATLELVDASVELGTDTLILDGAVTHTDASRSLGVDFDQLVIDSATETVALSGAVQIIEDSVTTLRVELCDGTTVVTDEGTMVTTANGCLVLTRPTGTISVGSLDDPISLMVGESFVAVDGDVSLHDPEGALVVALGMEAWRADDLDPEGLLEGYHRNVTGRVSVRTGAFTGSLASMEGLEASLSVDGDTRTVTLDGDLSVEVSDGTSMVTGTVIYTALEVVSDGSTTSLLGVTEMSFQLDGSSLLPAENLRLTYGDGVVPFQAAVSGDTTTLDGSVGVGVDCAPTCAMDVTANLTGVAYDSLACARQHPHAGTAELTGLTPTLAAVIPALQVSCDCNGVAGNETLLAETLTMQFDADTPVSGIVAIPAATGLCVTLRTPGMSCNDAGEVAIAPTACM